MTKKFASFIETERLLLRKWRSNDLVPFCALNADPKVMEFFPSILSCSETAAMIKRIEEKFIHDGFCFWATELKSTKEFIGFVGLNVPSFHAAFTPCVEIGWRLAEPFWGYGYAQELGRACLEYGNKELGIDEVLAFTAVQNLRSRNVMVRIGMVRSEEDDFDHPLLNPGHPLRRHVLYRYHF